MTNHVCIDCQDDCGVCESMQRHPAGKGKCNHLEPGNIDIELRDNRHFCKKCKTYFLATIGELRDAFPNGVSDPVNHPSHYTTDPSGVECIQITRHRNFNIGNAIKYLWRAGLKDGNATTQDLQKAVFYIMDEIKRLEGENK